MKKKFILAIFFSLLVMLQVSMAQEEGIERIEPVNTDTFSQDLLLPILILFVFGFIIWLVIFLFKKNLVLMWAIFGGLYVLIPSLMALTFGSSGEPGPYYLFVLPPFWPAFLTFSLLAMLSALPILFGGLNLIKIDGVETAIIIINIFVWIVIGGFIGYLIKKAGRNKKVKK